MVEPANLKAISKDKSVLVTWKAVEGADGYVLRIYDAAKPEKVLKTRYVFGTTKRIFGLTNKKLYFIEVCAFENTTDDIICGPYSEKVSVTPIAQALSAQKYVGMRTGETFQLNWEYMYTTPTVKFFSSDENVVSVDENGMLTANNPGCAVIRLCVTDSGRVYTEKRYTFDTTVFVDRDFERTDTGDSEITICLAGDLVCGAKNQRAYKPLKYDFSDAFSYYIKKELDECDYSIGVLETYCDDTRVFESEEARVFNTPSTFISAIKNAGIDSLVTTDLRTTGQDQGMLKATLKNMKNCGVVNLDSLNREVSHINIKGIDVGLIALAESDLTGANINEMVNKARTDGADYVIALMTWGWKNSFDISDSQQNAAQILADSGVDIIVGASTHMLQDIDYLSSENGQIVPCIYSIGDFYSSATDYEENDYGVIVKLIIRKTPAGVASFFSLVPCFMNLDDGRRFVDIATPDKNKVSQGAYEHISDIYGADRLRECYDLFPNVLTIGSSVSENILSKADIKTNVIREYNFDEELTSQIIGGVYRYLLVDFWQLLQSSEYLANSAVWDQIIVSFAKQVDSLFDNQNVVLIRVSFSERGCRKNHLRTCPENTANDILKKMEERFIGLVNPMVIDLCPKYFRTVSTYAEYEFEPLFNEHCGNIIKSIFTNKCETNRFYYSRIDEEIWMRRVLMYYDSMIKGNRNSWILEKDCAADEIIAGTSYKFISLYQKEIIELKKSHAALGYCKCDGELGEAVEILKQIKDKDNSIRPYNFYLVAFKYEFNCLKDLRLKMDGILKNKGISAYINGANIERICSVINDDARLRLFVSTMDVYYVDIWGSSISRNIVERIPDKICVKNSVTKQACVLFEKNPIEYELPAKPIAYLNNEDLMNEAVSSFRMDGKRRISESDADWMIIDLYNLACVYKKFRNGKFIADENTYRMKFFKDIQDECTDTYLFEEMDIDEYVILVRKFANFVKSKYDDRIVLVKTDIKSQYISLSGSLENIDESENILRKKRNFINVMERIFEEETQCYIIDIAKHFYADDAYEPGGAGVVNYEDEFYRLSSEYLMEIFRGSRKSIFDNVSKEYLMSRDAKIC